MRGQRSVRTPVERNPEHRLDLRERQLTRRVGLGEQRTCSPPNSNRRFWFIRRQSAVTLSYTVTVSGLPHDAFELHIHPNVGQEGGNLLNLTPPPANGTVSGTVGANRTILIKLYERPQDFFAAVHEDPAFPAYTLTGFFSRP